MSPLQIARSLSGRASACFDLLGIRLRQSSHVFRRGKTKNMSLILMSIVGLLALVAVIRGIHGGDMSMEMLTYDNSKSNGTAQGSAGYDEFDEVADASYSDYENINAQMNSANAGIVGRAVAETLKRIKKFSLEGELDKTRKKECDIGDISITDTAKFYKLTEESLANCVQLPEETFLALREGFEGFRKAIVDDLLPLFMDVDQPAFHGEGIVMVGGGKYSLFALPAIKAIRENSGVKIQDSVPIEIIIPPQDKADRGFCENVLPALDPSGLTRCVFLDEVLGEETLSHLKGYQLKPLALLVSTFEKALMLDSDNYVINSLEGYFTNGKFNEKGLVLWPDYWRRLHHPKIYEILNLKLGRDQRERNSIDDTSPTYLYDVDSKKTPLHDLKNTIPDGGTESGQLLVNKKKHLDTLLMSLYFNYNGPSYYYPLLGQGFAGEGDKDTFVLASRVLHGPDSWHQVKTPVSAMGHWTDSKDEIRLTDEDLENYTKEKSFRGTAMLQHDYIEDIRCHAVAQEVIRNTISNKEKLFCESWIKSHKDDFTGKIEEKREQCKKNAEAQKVFQSEIRDSYSLADYFAFFKFTKVSFVHSHLPKYDPWEWYETGDMKFDGAKAHKNHKDDALYKPAHSGHYRMYDSKMREISGYDLELANWSAFNTYLCDVPDGYKNFGYLSEKIAASESPVQGYRGMCKYISDRVEYLKSTTWEDINV
ncbi:LAME_0F06040g1_1 [Lachancea meyersii CBS 8951]|uniref:LAME_0F06040g1_1 n=1 Tax=Lachancea meyersii CBS 8951 TaxID=1266667 RepID=A0A1G4JTK0_9SACH|nr:LAME_0F06040g1_1 [Lachancea meyersii CBS 8951]